MPDDHSKLVPLLPIPNRTVKRLRADDSADSCVKVGHRQALMLTKPPLCEQAGTGFAFCLLKRLLQAARRGQEGLSQGLGEKKFSRMLRQDARNCVIIQGFADRGEANEVR